jgi:hypothetical protein
MTLTVPPTARGMTGGLKTVMAGMIGRARTRRRHEGGGAGGQVIAAACQVPDLAQRPRPRTRTTTGSSIWARDVRVRPVVRRAVVRRAVVRRAVVRRAAVRAVLIGGVAAGGVGRWPVRLAGSEESGRRAGRLSLGPASAGQNRPGGKRLAETPVRGRRRGGATGALVPFGRPGRPGRPLGRLATTRDHFTMGSSPNKRFRCRCNRLRSGPFVRRLRRYAPTAGSTRTNTPGRFTRRTTLAHSECQAVGSVRSVRTPASDPDRPRGPDGTWDSHPDPVPPSIRHPSEWPRPR